MVCDVKDCTLRVCLNGSTNTQLAHCWCCAEVCFLGVPASATRPGCRVMSQVHSIRVSTVCDGGQRTATLLRFCLAGTAAFCAGHLAVSTFSKLSTLTHPTEASSRPGVVGFTRQQRYDKCIGVASGDSHFAVSRSAVPCMHPDAPVQGQSMAQCCASGERPRPRAPRWR
jgi:hypothetical protein